jgi:hypothetical protein
VAQTQVGAKALEYFRLFGAPVALGGIDGRTLDLLASDFGNELLELVDQRLVRPAETAVRQSILGSRDRAQVVNEVKQQIDSGGILRKDGKQFTDVNTETFIDQANQNFFRVVTAQKARSLDMNIYIYRGPFDSRTRPACQAILSGGQHGVPGAYYEDEISINLHPDLARTGNPLANGGGFNCRHKFMPISATRAESLGFVIDRPVEEQELENVT